VVLVEAVDALEVPAPLVAVDENLYAVLLDKPVIMHEPEAPVTVQVLSGSRAVPLSFNAVTVYVEGVPPLLGATTVTVTCESPATAVGVPGVPGADSEICAVTADVPTSDCATLFTVLVPVTTVRKYFPASPAPAVYVAEVAPEMSAQLVAPASVQRCH
jgi:hypothetical protein